MRDSPLVYNSYSYVLQTNSAQTFIGTANCPTAPHSSFASQSTYIFKKNISTLQGSDQDRLSPATKTTQIESFRCTIAHAPPEDKVGCAHSIA
jgi:hypothetical protein